LRRNTTGAKRRKTASTPSGASRQGGGILFVALAGNKVIAVKDEYAGLGGDVQ